MKDFLLAILDHLVGDLDKETSHLIVGVVESSDGMDHLDCIHESRKGIDNLLRGAFVEWFQELLKGREVLHVILGFVQLIGEQQIESVVVDHQLVDVLVSTTLAIMLLVAL